MIVAELFAREHALFRGFVDRLELDLSQRREGARDAVSEALRMLLPALDRHSEIEDIVFRHPPDLEDNASRALTEVDAQHAELAALRDEILSALEQSAEELPFTRLKALTEALIADLRVHLHTEETRLWPFYKGALGRTVEAVVPIDLGKRALALEKELERGIAAISHSSSRSDADS